MRSEDHLRGKEAAFLELVDARRRYLSMFQATSVQRVIARRGKESKMSGRRALNNPALFAERPISNYSSFLGHAVFVVSLSLLMQT